MAKVKRKSWVRFVPKDKRLSEGGATWFRKGKKVICIPGREA